MLAFTIIFIERLFIKRFMIINDFFIDGLALLNSHLEKKIDMTTRLIHRNSVL